jgi:hypothetical protein
MRSMTMLTTLGMIVWMVVALTAAPRAWKHQLILRPHVASFAAVVICPDTRAQLVQRVATQPMVQRIVGKIVETAVWAFGESRRGK